MGGGGRVGVSGWVWVGVGGWVGGWAGGGWVGGWAAAPAGLVQVYLPMTSHTPFHATLAQHYTAFVTALLHSQAKAAQATIKPVCAVAAWNARWFCHGQEEGEKADEDYQS